MSVSEPARLALYNRLGEVIGPENAETLMSSLPLQPAAELATKADIARLEERIDSLAPSCEKYGRKSPRNTEPS